MARGVLSTVPWVVLFEHPLFSPHVIYGIDVDYLVFLCLQSFSSVEIIYLFARIVSR